MDNSNAEKACLDILQQIYPDYDVILNYSYDVKAFTEKYCMNKNTILISYEGVEPLIKYEDKAIDIKHLFTVFITDVDIEVSYLVEQLIIATNGKKYSCKVNGKDCHIAIIGAGIYDNETKPLFTIGIELFYE